MSNRGWVGVMMALVLSGCASRTPADQAGLDQEITRDILWRLRQDSRFSEVRVRCENRLVTLEGRVSDPQAAEDALRIARDCASGGKAISKLDVFQR